MVNSASTKGKIGLFLALTAFISTPSVAKCGNVRYTLAVRVLDRATGVPISNAQILFFLPGHDSALLKAGSASSVGLTDNSGWFTGDFLFNPYSGWWFGDRCKAELSQVQVLVVPTDRPAERFDLRELQPTGAARNDSVPLHPVTVELFPPPDVQPSW